MVKSKIAFVVFPDNIFNMYVPTSSHTSALSLALIVTSNKLNPGMGAIKQCWFPYMVYNIDILFQNVYVFIREI